jgi:hypothetical protein
MNAPVLAPDGEIRFILHRVEDVTAFSTTGTGLARATDSTRLEVLLRSQELFQVEAVIAAINTPGVAGERQTGLAHTSPGTARWLHVISGWPPVDRGVDAFGRARDVRPAPNAAPMRAQAFLAAFLSVLVDN